MSQILSGLLTEALLLTPALFGLALTIRLLDFPDLTYDGSLVLGAAVGAQATLAGTSLWLGAGLALLAGGLAGCLTTALNRVVGLSKLLAGIVSMTMLYSVNLRILGGANLSLMAGQDGALPIRGLARLSDWTVVVSLAALGLAIGGALSWGLRTRRGLALRGVGMNPKLVAVMGFSEGKLTLLGLVLANALVAPSGCLSASYHRSVDVSIGIGALILGLACLVLGEAAVRAETIGRYLWSAPVGAVSYFAVVSVALRLGIRPSDLRLVTGLILVGALFAFRHARRSAPFRSSW